MRSAIVFALLLCATSVAASCTYNILVGMSSAGHITLTNGKTPVIGFYLDELAIPAQELVAAGFNLTYANPRGNRPPMDPTSNSSKYFNNNETAWEEALAFVATTSNLNNPILYSEIDDSFLENFDAIFIPGGHPPMVDLWNNEYLGAILNYFHNAGKPTGAICHGPVALVSANLSGDPWIYDNYMMTVFSTAGDKIKEQEWGGMLPFYPEDILRDTGAIVIEKPLGTPHYIIDKEVTTGQNPYSAELFATNFLDQLMNYCNTA